jgi:signal transduction histidine kinase
MPSEALERTILERRLTLALEIAGGGTWDWDCVTGGMRWSAESEFLFGSAVDCPTTFDAFLKRVHAADRECVAQTMAAARSMEPLRGLEFRGVTDHRPERWIRVIGAAQTSRDSLRMLGVFMDVTSRHDAERQLRDLRSRLIAAHEQERSRLSRELHDDISQQLTLLSVAFEELRRELRDAPEDARARADTLSVQLGDLASALHRVSHELHPALIRQVGFERALRSLCSEVGRAHQVAIDCQFAISGPVVDHDVGLGLYRIAQEALTNVVKHSGSRRASVSIDASDDKMVLIVADTGAGFDPAALADRDSLGLINMRERVRFMNGRLNVTASPGTGTRIEVLVPFNRS